MAGRNEGNTITPDEDKAFLDWWAQLEIECRKNPNKYLYERPKFYAALAWVARDKELNEKDKQIRNIRYMRDRLLKVEVRQDKRIKELEAAAAPTSRRIGPLQ